MNNPLCIVFQQLANTPDDRRKVMLSRTSTDIITSCVECWLQSKRDVPATNIVLEYDNENMCVVTGLCANHAEIEI